MTQSSLSFRIKLRSMVAIVATLARLLLLLDVKPRRNFRSKKNCVSHRIFEHETLTILIYAHNLCWCTATNKNHRLCVYVAKLYKQFPIPWHRRESKIVLLISSDKQVKWWPIRRNFYFLQKSWISIGNRKKFGNKMQSTYFLWSAIVQIRK